MLIKWGKSKGGKNPGQTTCGCWLGGKRLSLVVGSGFDVRGSAFGEFLGVAFGKRLMKYVKDNPLAFKRYERGTGKNLFRPIVTFFPGVTVYQTGEEITHVEIEGAVGFSHMVELAEKALGLTVSLINETATIDTYTLTEA
jgi:hypothetical protein